MQTNVFSGIIILEGIMSAKMSGMDVDLELALCYRQSFWIMSWTMTWKFQIQTSSRIVLLAGITVGGCECGSIDSNFPYLSVIVVAQAQSALDENGSWGRCVSQIFQVPWNQQQSPFLLKTNIGRPAMLNCIWCARSLCWTWRTASSPSALFWPWPPPLCTSTRLNLVSSICKLLINVQSIVVDSR